MKRFALFPIGLSMTMSWAAVETTLPEVTVTANSESDIAERRESATQKVIIDRADIEKMGALTIGDVMGKLPGVDAGATGADGAMALRSRGMVRDSVQILIDGERMAGGGRMAQGIVGRLPSSELLRVEILRGSSAEVGGNAPLTVNLILNKPMSRESTAFKTALGARDGRALAQTSFSKGGGDKNFSWLLPISLNHHDMPTTRQMSRSDSTGLLQQDHEQGDRQTEEFVFSPRLIWKSGNDNLTVSPVIFRSFGQGENAFDRMDLTTPANNATRQDTESSRNSFNRLRVDGEMLRQGTKYTARLALSDGERTADTQRNTLGASSIARRSNEQMRRLEQDQNSALRMDWSAGPHMLAASIEESGHRREESQLNTGLSVQEQHSASDQQWSAWVQDEWTLGSALTLTTGFRGESIRYTVDGLAQDFQQLLPSVAIRWEPAKDWVARTSLGAGMKPPQLAELSNQPVFSTNANTPLEPDKRGNPNLRPEHSLNLEAVLEHYLPNEAGVIGVNAYLRHTDDFTERRVQLEGTSWVDRPYNEGFAQHWGLEVDGKLRTDSLGWRGATIRGHLTLPRSEVQDARLGITRAARDTPRYLLSAGFDQTKAEMSYGVSMQYSAEVVTQVPAEQAYETRQRVVFDAYALQKVNAKLNLRLSMQNLFGAETSRQMDAFSNASYWSSGSVDKGARSVLLSLEGKW